MSEKVKLSKDGNSIDFVQSDIIPTSIKKFRQSPEIEGFYRFLFENDLQREAYEILEKIISVRKAKKSQARKDAKEAAQLAAAASSPNGSTKKAEAKASPKSAPKAAAPATKATAKPQAKTPAAKEPKKSAPKKAPAPVKTKKK